CLHYRRGDLGRAAEYLAAWRDQEPTNAVPLVRLAVVERRRGQGPAAWQLVRQALPHADGSRRAAVAFAGARLALADCFDADEPRRRAARTQARDFLEECVRAEPHHSHARWCLAALAATEANGTGLATLAPTMHGPEVGEPAFHFLAAVCHLAAGDDAAAESATCRARDLADGGQRPAL